jgi:putative toxin-antitoxin system antitoxin component (TIGR02293 family)
MELAILPRNLWHNVYMSQAVTVSISSAPLQFDLQAIEKGVPLSALEKFASQTGIEMKGLLNVVIAPRTLKHRRERKEPLSLDESDRLARVARMYELSVRVFGDPEKAKKWITSPKHRFADRSPLSMMRSETGGRQVEEWLIQIDEGMFA